jgi:hypothetical protein
MRPSALFLVLAALGSCTCSRSPVPCTTPGTCPAGEECLANRCVASGSEPVGSNTRRLVLMPTSLGLVSATTEAGNDPLPGVVVFGSQPHGASTLYLNFSPEWRRYDQVDSAFVLLEPMPGTSPAREPTEVTAWRVRQAWTARDLGRITQPPLGAPTARALARSAPPQTLRIDITAIVRYWAAHPRSAHGLALRAAGGNAHGASFSTGFGEGIVPRLELYVR